MLETKEAKAAFAPLAFRRWLLAASSAAVAWAMGIATLALELAPHPRHELAWVAMVLGLPLLAVSLLASAVGVARMRAWGILLGALTSVLALILGATASLEAVLGAVVASAALPGAMMAGAITIARTRASQAPPRASTTVRIASEPEPVVRATWQRIAAPEEVRLEVLDAPDASTRTRA
jgi:hypothetical protein